MKQKLLALTLIILLSSCYKNWYKPMGRIFRTMPKGGTPGYELGWIHGCESGLGTQFGGEVYKMFYGWKKDPDIVSSNPNYNKIRLRYRSELKKVDWNNQKEVDKNISDYKKIFPIAYFYCRQSVLGILQSANMTPDLPGDNKLLQPFEHNAVNVFIITGNSGDTWQGWF